MTASYSDLQDKVVLLTGGANGIGAATVRAFLNQRARVYFCDIDESAGKALAEETDGAAQFARVDLRKEKQIQSWIAAVAKKEGRINALINDAAVDPRIAVENIGSADWDHHFDVNVKAPFLACREAFPHMPKHESAIVNFASITFHIGPELMSAYVATKGGVIGLTRSLARELGPKGIRVNTLSPGWIMTDRQLKDYVDSSTKVRIKKSQCVPELIQPEDIAEVVLFLASNASRAITGQEILADRGWSYS